MTTNDLVLRCFVLKKKNYWVGMCIDLDLVAQADTPEQVRSALSAQMHDYVSEAVNKDAEHVAVLLTRKAPLRYRFMYYVVKLARATRRRFSYEAALPLTPAA